ncbi:serine/threonine-protein kinase Nek1-like isoform X2 [Myxocyprinus asiaticus]|uniref:serine/threonine-protein kinase Nek1-like isoform X2 n=1 Tax=Myxocyprinus asiaticus TaxID=70543 RepID=UPI002222276D|nr:serine/threonine-protein kinase Nek1-like isoform X2 [Myxocyprinus asiaticus]
MDKYERLKKIGEGSFGKAILVKSRADGRQYVIKEIGISRMSNKERQESRKEVSVLANMSHPNIVQYKESFEESGCLYIVMDYCEGGDLFKKINNQKGSLFQEEQILDWFVQICLALKHVHDRKILHRDIKSQNIFLTKDGTVQLGDFGIARVLNSTVELARTCIGTPYYLSPEICENKPYNNKSDIWALGCVLYEMCTLKHAFEAGNMKNLVLKIIRGSYPLVSVHYSLDLRSLLAQLFKRNPRERPSVSAILDKPFLARRIHKFLSPQLIAQEFSRSLHLNQPKMSVAQGVPAKRPAPSPIPISPAQKITKPAAKYGVPLTARRPSEAIRKVPDAARKPVKKAPPPAAAQRRLSRVEEERRKHEEGVRKKRMEMMDRERKQREQMLILKAAQMKRFEREKLNQINRAREQGWRHVLSSSGGSSPEHKLYGAGGIGAAHSPGIAPAPHSGLKHATPYLPGPTPTPALAPSRAPYDHVLPATDKPSKPTPKDGAVEGAKSSGDNSRTPADSGTLNGHACIPNQNVVKREPRKASLQNELISKKDYASRLRGQLAAERAKQVEDFLQRKREAMQNKVRAEGQLGARHNLAAIFASWTNSARCRRPRVNKEEEEYLSRLRQIRLQNFNERQQIKARLRGEKYDSDGSDSQESCEEAALRRKKTEALKAQSKARAAVLKEQLEKKRREAYEREKKAWEDHLVARGVNVGIGAVCGAPPPAVPPTQESDPTPQEDASKVTPSSRHTTPAISMTAALKDVGAISSGLSSLMKEDPLKAETSDVQSEKKEILCRLNLNLKVQSLEEEPEKDATSPCSKAPSSTPQLVQPSTTEERPPTGGDRRKWEAVAPPILSITEQTLKETCATLAVPQAVSPELSAPSGGDRKKWQTDAVPLLSVAQQTLEETSLTTQEHTAGEVIRMDVWQGEGLRKAWGQSPDSDVLKVLEEAEIQSFTQQLAHASTCDNTLTESLNPIEESTDVTNEAKQVPLPEPCQPATGHAKQEVTCQETVPITTEVKSQELIPPTPEDIQKPQSGESEPEEVDDLESVVLEEASEQTSKLPTEVMQAWANDSPMAVPEEGRRIQAECTEIPQREVKQPEPAADESLFVKLSSSPAHRRTVALALLSAQSSVEDSSSVASRSRSVSPLRSHCHDNTLLIGLSTGLFDANNPKMLRTCSLPDLSKVFNDAAEPEGAVAPESNLEIEDLEDKADEQSETEDVYEDDDLRELRASMERLLQEQHSEDDDDDEEEDEGSGSNGSPADEEAVVLNGLVGAGDNKHSPEEKCCNGVAEEDDDGSHDEEEPGGPVTNGIEVEEDEEQNSSEGLLNEEWQSDDSEKEDDEDLEQQDSIFSRLEELRFHLEQAMGFENFIQAYNKIKAIHEDEDENIEMGSSMVQSILGTEHQHLYPKILNLVMADGAYQEDNDE